MINPIVDIIYGGQYGSEAKRLFNEFYFNKTNPDAIVSNFGPNSGGFVSDGSKWAVFSFGANCLHMLSPGSIIDLERFEEEVKKLPQDASVMVHENACIVLPEHKEEEKKLVSIGSTMTGTASAVVQKLMRPTDPDNQNIAKHYISKYTVDTKQWFDTIMSLKRIQLSVPQGHSLSINFGMYPYCTSRNCSPQQALADAGIPIQLVDKIIGCFRTFPIRVANRYDENGNMIGWSGPCYNDQIETNWDTIGVEKEYTSVSNNVRRVFTFSIEQIVESCRLNGTTDVFLNFMNYLSKGRQQELFFKLTGNGIKIKWLGFGPKTSDIATVSPVDPSSDIDGRIGCHPTLFEMGDDKNV